MLKSNYNLVHLPLYGADLEIDCDGCSFSAEIQHCLVSAGDVGCSVFECFENNSCEIRGLHEICMTFLHNAGKFDAQVSITAPKSIGPSAANAAELFGVYVFVLIQLPVFNTD